jgi:hypothetical protein
MPPASIHAASGGDSSRPIQGIVMSSNENQIDQMKLARLGIRHVEEHVFQRGEYIYSSLRDAIAAAKRDKK